MKRFIIFFFLVFSAVTVHSQDAHRESVDDQKYAAFKARFSKIILYPVADRELNKSGWVILSFEVTPKLVFTAIKIEEGYSANASEKVVQALESMSKGPWFLTAGRYTLRVNFFLDGEPLEMPTSSAGISKASHFLGDVNVVGYADRYRTVWIIDRWPQPVFSNMVLGEVKEVCVDHFEVIHEKSSFWYSKRFDRHQLDSLAGHLEPFKRRVVKYNSGQKILLKYNHARQITDSIVSVGRKLISRRHYKYISRGILHYRTYNQKHQLIDSAHFFYGVKDSVKMCSSHIDLTGKSMDQHFKTFFKGRLCEDTWLLTAATGDSQQIVDRYFYDSQGRRIEEQYSVNGASVGECVCYHYMEFDEQDNWTSAERYDNGRLVDVVKRSISYK